MLSIRAKLVVLCATCSIFMVLIGAVGFFGLKSADKGLDRIYNENMVGIEHLSEIGDLLRDCRIQLLLATQHDPSNAVSKLHDHPTDTHLEAIKKALPEIDKLWTEYSKSLDTSNPEEAKAVQRLKESLDKIIATGIKPALVAAQEGKYQEVSALVVQQINPLAKTAFEGLEEVIKKEHEQATANITGAERVAVRTMVVNGVLLAVALGFSSLIALFLIRSITRSCRNLADAAGSMAQGDLTVRVADTGRDELGRVGASFNAMADAFGSLISQVTQTAERVATAAGQVFSTAEQMATGAEEVASQAATVATAGEEMSATSGDIAQNCSMAAEASQQANHKAVSGAEVVQSSVGIMNQIADRVKSTSVTIASLGTRSDQIGAIIGTIEDIADQTNLLALNAAIEAARAGEQGRGFAVVADEVRALAERTTRATREIGEMIKSIQHETRAAVGAMDEGVSKVEEGREEAGRSGAAIEEILQQINEVTMQINQIATAAEEQTATTSEISSNMMQITEVVQQTAQGAHESARAAQQLNSIAEELQALVRRFRLA